MSKSLYKRIDYSLANLIERIDMGEIGLPDIQRPFVWEATKVRDLFDSMYRDLMDQNETPVYTMLLKSAPFTTDKL